MPSRGLQRASALRGATVEASPRSGDDVDCLVGVSGWIGVLWTLGGLNPLAWEWERGRRVAGASSAAEGEDGESKRRR
jgi:hypothetical protein